MKHICRLLIFLQVAHQGTTQAHRPEVLVNYPSSGIVKEGGKLKLQCRYSGKDNYIYWFKNNKHLHYSSNEFYETLADSSSGGTYQCRVWSERWQMSKLLEVVTIASDMILTLEVKTRAALSDERISLKCLVPDRKGKGYFLWYRNEKLISGNSQSQYIITKAKLTDEASYRCAFRRDYRKWVSPDVNVTVTGGDVTLQVDPPSALEGDHLNLNCRSRFYWHYGYYNVAFYKDSTRIHSMKMANRETLHRIKVNSSENTGSYHCTIYNKKSRRVEVHIRELFSNPTLWTEPEGEIFEGQQIIFFCSVETIPSDIWLKYSFYKNAEALNFNSGKKYKLTDAASLMDSGTYLCEANAFHRGVKKKSDEVSISVKELFSKPTLRTEPAGDLFEGQQLKMICVVENIWSNIGLQYSFYKNGEVLNLNLNNNCTRMEAALLNDSGTYLCEANALKHSVRKKSDDVLISVKEVFSKPTLRAESEAQLYEGQQLKLACLVEIFRSSSSLRYGFYKDGQALNSPAEHNYYIKETSRLNDSGSYLCEATTLNREVKKLSNAVSVSVRRIPVSKPELAISPGKQLIEGDTASLTCSVFNGSTPITYIFYKVSNKELYREESDLTEITYQIGKDNKSVEGDYSCSVSNEAAEPPLHSGFIAVSVMVPVAGAALTFNTNKTEISAGDRLVLQCQLKSGTAPHFRWYLNNQQLESTSESYHLSSDGTELIINSFQPGHGGRYHCVATNRGTYGGLFNTTSNYIDITLPAQSHTTVITASVLPPFLIAALIVLVFFKLRKKKQDNSLSVPQPQGEATGNRSRPPSEETSASNFEYAVVGSARNTASSSDQATYCVVQGTKPMEEDTKPAADLVYSVVTIRKSRDGGNDGGASGGRQDNSSDYCVTYATVNRESIEASLEGDLMEEGDGSDTNVYENLPRK